MFFHFFILHYKIEDVPSMFGYIYLAHPLIESLYTKIISSQDSVPKPHPNYYR